MKSIPMVLGVASLILFILSGIGKCPDWVPGLLLCIAFLLSIGLK